MAPPRPTDLRHLGDFDVGPRLLAITAFALPIGALSAGVAWCLLRLIGLITNLVFYGRLGTALVAPGEGAHSPLVILLAPICGGLVIGLMARFGSEKIRGHGIPEAIESILISRQQGPAAGGAAEAARLGDRDRHRRPVRRRGADHHDRRRRRLDLRAAPAPDRRRAQDPARRRRRGGHGGDLRRAARRGPAGGRAAALRVAPAQLHPGRRRGRASPPSSGVPLLGSGPRLPGRRPGRSTSTPAPTRSASSPVVAAGLLAVVATALVYALRGRLPTACRSTGCGGPRSAA